MLQRLSRRRIVRLAADIDLLDKRMVEIVATDDALRLPSQCSFPVIQDAASSSQDGLGPISPHWDVLRGASENAARSVLD
jgi:hypothetical protein